MSRFDEDVVLTKLQGLREAGSRGSRNTANLINLRVLFLCMACFGTVGSLVTASIPSFRAPLLTRLASNFVP